MTEGAAAAPLDPAFDGVLRRDPHGRGGSGGGGGGRCEYFQDRHKRWAFNCDDDGYELLSRLLRAATPVVGRRRHVPLRSLVCTICIYSLSTDDEEAPRLT